MTVYAGIGAPRDGVILPASTSFVAYHTYASDGTDNPSGDDYQQAAEERYRLVGAGTWTTRTQVLSSQPFDVYTGGLPAGSYERQVRVLSTNSGVWSAFSESAFFSTATTPGAPTWTAPAAGATITTTTVTCTWTTPATQTAYEIEIRTATGGNGTREATTGKVVTSTKTNVFAPPVTGNVARYLRVRYWDTNDVVSAWTERQIIVNYPAVATPTMTLVAQDLDGIGMLHALTATVSNPAPTGGQPTVTNAEVWFRPQGDASEGVRGIVSAVPSGPMTWYGPSARRYEGRVKAISADGRSTFSAWTLANVANTVKGVILQPWDSGATAPTNRTAFRYNEEEARDTWDTDAALIEYAGRGFPVAEYGDGESRILEVPLIHSRGTAPGDAQALIALLRLKKPVLYRDRRGRKMYGLLKVGQVVDTFYGYATGITLTAVDWAADREMF